MAFEHGFSLKILTLVQGHTPLCGGGTHQDDPELGWGMHSGDSFQNQGPGSEPMQGNDCNMSLRAHSPPFFLCGSHRANSLLPGHPYENGENLDSRLITVFVVIAPEPLSLEDPVSL